MSSLETPTHNWDGNVGHGSILVVMSFIISVTLATGALVVTSGDGAQMARELVARFALLIFVGSLLVTPLASLFPTRPSIALARLRGSLRLSFVAAFVFSLACILMPAAVAGEALPASTALYIGLNGGVLFIMLFPTNRTAMQLMGSSAWRAIQLIATTYFWLSFLVAAFIQLISDDGFKVWYFLVLMLLVAPIGATFAARVRNTTQRPMA